MSPLLSSGRRDQVLVDKRAFGGRDPAPFEVVVLRPTGGATPIVKRAIAVGPARVALRGGDVFVDRLDGSGFERLQRDPSDPLGTIRSVWELGVDRTLPFEGAFESRGTDLRLVPDRWLRTDRELFGSSPELTVPGSSQVTDFGVRLEPDWQAVGFVEIELRAGERTDRVRVSASGVVSRVTGPVGETMPAHDDESPVRLPAPLGRLLVLRLDGRICVQAGSDMVEFPLQAVVPPDLVLPGSVPFAGVGLRMQSTDGSELVLRDLSLVVDVHYPPESQAFDLADGELFVLGDNPAQSEDSRALRGAPFHRRQLLGRVVGIIRDGRLSLTDR